MELSETDEIGPGGRPTTFLVLYGEFDSRSLLYIVPSQRRYKTRTLLRVIWIVRQDWNSMDMYLNIVDTLKYSLVYHW